jgi:hypothetical protein
MGVAFKPARFVLALGREKLLGSRTCGAKISLNKGLGGRGQAASRP